MIRKNITSIFMVPTLKIGKKKLNSNGFVNAYIKDSRRDVQYDECIYLLFHPENLDAFREFLDEEYERTKSIVDEYDYENGFVVVVYKLDEQFKEDFQLIREGKYSKTSEKFQEQFPKFVTIEKDKLKKEEISLQFRVFNKTSDLQEFWEEKIGVRFTSEQEFWEGFHEENEILDLDDIKKKFNNKLEYESK